MKNRCLQDMRAELDRLLAQLREEKQHGDKGQVDGKWRTVAVGIGGDPRSYNMFALLAGHQ